MTTISFVIPVYNEQKRLAVTFQALREIQGKFPRGLRLEKVIFVDDGSNDNTFARLQKWISEQDSDASKYSIISYKSNRGKGFAVRQGMLASSSDYTLFLDADISTPLSELKKFMPEIKNRTEVIVGTRKNGKSTVIVHQPLYRELLGKAFTKLTKTLLRINISDFTCGFKAFSKNAKNEIFSPAIIDGWGYDAEILSIAKEKKFSIKEVPVLWSDDKGSKVNVIPAIIRTLWELAQIKWQHSLKPSIQLYFSSFPVRVRNSGIKEAEA